MGANCCVAAKDKPLPIMNGHEVSTYRNIRYSPSWSFRWHSRTHIEDLVENLPHFSPHNSGNATFEGKSVADTETDGLSDGESLPKDLPSSQWRKDGNSFICGSSDNSEFVAAVIISSHTNYQEIELKKSEIQNTTSKILYGGISTEGAEDAWSEFWASLVPVPPLSPSAMVDDCPSSSRTKPCHSPDYRLRRQISDSRILKSLNEYSSPERDRHSFMLSNDLSAGGSHGGSSDGWSMRMFSELVASSQRERWSFESHENLAPVADKISHSGILPKTSPVPDLQTCGICSKLLKEKSPWSAQKILSTSDLPIAGVLFCGHVYHADCLESYTSEIEMYDPPCPVCMNNGETSALKPLAKFELKGGRHKISQITDADVHRDSNRDDRRSGKSPMMGASASMKMSSLSKPFLRRLSIGSRPSRSASVTERTPRKRFWSKY
ncbi:hypothetical protein KSP40_PGU009786 [Platanthera guangdongensis]|uniref:RING-type domain-containing protein n=1 Tax=Platanthera guangdongensis TaxID=2320717 RepID=A0ABR2LFI4_9ASPA